MPTYQYRCKSCTREFEVRQSFAEDPIVACLDDACDGSVNKVFSGVGISFKGDGFYKNDHGSNRSTRTTDSSPSTDASSTPASTGTSSSSSSSEGSSGSSGSSGSPAPASASTSSD